MILRIEGAGCPRTGIRCVDRIITDLAVIDVTGEGLVLREIAPGVRVEEVRTATEARSRRRPIFAG